MTQQKPQQEFNIKFNKVKLNKINHRILSLNPNDVPYYLIFLVKAIEKQLPSQTSFSTQKSILCALAKNLNLNLNQAPYDHIFAKTAQLLYDDLNQQKITANKTQHQQVQNTLLNNTSNTNG